MKKILFVLTILVFATPSLSQTKEIPNWFLDDLAANIGIWTTDNSKYLSENETIDTYEIPVLQVDYTVTKMESKLQIFGNFAITGIILRVKRQLFSLGMVV